MSDKSVRQKFAREFRSFHGHSKTMCWLILGSYLVQIVGALAVGALVLAGPMSWLAGIALFLLVFFVGTRLRGLNNIVHECSHFAFCRERDLNILFGRICCALIFKSFQEYRIEHMSHHAHLGDYEHDLDFHLIRDLRIEDPLTPRTVLRHVITPFLGLHLKYYLSFNFTAQDGWPYAALKGAMVAAALICLVIDPVAALVLLVAPFVFALTTINYWTDCIDHGGLFGSDDELDGSRNVILPTPLRLLFFPRNDCFHLIHHLFPQIPVRHFDECHERLLSDPEYRRRAEAQAMFAEEDLAPVVVGAEGGLAYGKSVT